MQLASLAKALGPIVGSTMYAWSVSRESAKWPLDQHLVFYFCAGCLGVAAWMAARFPPELDQAPTASNNNNEASHRNNDVEDSGIELTPATELRVLGKTTTTRSSSSSQLLSGSSVKSISIVAYRAPDATKIEDLR